MSRWGELVDVRPWDPRAERGLVVDSWRASWAPHTRPLLPPRLAGPIVEEYLRRCDRVLVAAVPGVDRLVCGWVARQGPGVLAYLYVLHDYRRRGIGDRLLREAGIDPRGPRWRYVFGTRRMLQLCRPDERHPDRVPWTGVFDGKIRPNGRNVDADRRGAQRG